MKYTSKSVRSTSATALLVMSAALASPSVTLAGAGFWGALGGLGEGMQDAADDWEYSARDERAYQRQLNLERQRYELEQQRLNFLRQQRLEEQRLAEQRLQQRAEERRQQAEEQYFQDEMAKLAAAHPDWQMVASSTAFHSWLNAQPYHVRAWYESETTTDAIRVLDRFNEYLKNESVMDIQRTLSALGYNPGPADGVLGPQTEAAIKGFEQDNGLSATGGITLELLAIVEY